jgi:hypothetical protein
VRANETVRFHVFSLLLSSTLKYCDVDEILANIGVKQLINRIDDVPG